MVLILVGGAAIGDHTPNDPSLIGELGPLIPFHKDAIHAGLGWSGPRGDSAPRPKICFWMRPAEYRGLHLVDPLLSPGADALLPRFEKYVYGREYTPGTGFSYSTGTHGLDESVATRIVADLSLDNGLCLDLQHPHAFRNLGKLEIGELTAEDFDLNRSAFSNAGHSAGLNYNIFCAGQVALADGRWVFVGGHDKAGNNGIRKITLFDPASQTWADRGLPSVKAGYLADPAISDPSLHPDPSDEANTDPPHPSDMRYQRWYPTAVHLPDDTVLALSGTDQDSSLPYPPRGGPPPPCSTDLSVPPSTPACSKYRPSAPELYLPGQDRTVTLESSWKLLSMYPIAYPVQTGRGEDDWKVAVIGEADHSEFGGPLCNGGQGFRGDRSDQRCGINILGFDPWPYSGKTYLYDVQAAANDPQRDTPDDSGEHWSLVASAAIAHEGGASAMLVKLDHEGRPLSQRLALFGGTCGQRPSGFACDRATVEMIDFQEPSPTWRRGQNLLQEVSDTLAVALPDGKVLLVGGLSGGRGAPPGGWRNSFHYQLFDPASGSVTPLVQTRLPTHDHATLLLLPDGSVIRMGGNRTDLAYYTGAEQSPPCNPGGQCSSQPTRDLGVPVAQVYKPPYFFKGDRPMIGRAPGGIAYGERFVVQLSRTPRPIKSVAMIQQHPTTHNHMWNRHVELWFEEGREGALIIQGPRVPGVAPPGNYLLFVVDEDGVPSVGSLLRVGAEAR